MKYLKKLIDHNAYEAFINSDEFTEIQEEKKDIIGYCKEDLHVHYIPYIPPVILAQPLDILYSDANGNLSFTSDILPVSEEKTPIAICVAGTNFFGDNEPARWMAFTMISSEEPFTGQREQGMVCGNKGVDLSLTNMQNIYNGGGSSGYLIDHNPNNSSSVIPSLFDTNNEWNLTVLGEKNTYAVTDVDGKNNTEIMLQAISRQTNWETASSIANEEGEGWSPAAACCARYHTLGTQAGDWYLPACGEYAMVLAQYQDIHDIFESIAEVYESTTVLYTNIIGNDEFLTSTEYDSNNIYCANPTTGYITIVGKDSGRYIVPFLQY